MAEPSKDTDQSMEDILQSIKRIIADESDPVPPTAGSDVLELTELLAEDAAVPETTVAGSISIDEIMAGPLSTESEPEPEATVMANVEPEPMVAAEPVVEPAASAPAFSAPAPTPAQTINTDSLISDATLAASVSALSALAQKPSPAAPSVHGHSFRSGTTVEDLVVESLRPMLKEWLDDHLPALVRNLVEKEIRRLSA